MPGATRLLKGWETLLYSAGSIVLTLGILLVSKLVLDVVTREDYNVIIGVQSNFFRGRGKKIGYLSGFPGGYLLNQKIFYLK